MTTRTAGPDYWFVDPFYDGIDRLTDDECPMDEIDKAQEWGEDEFGFAEVHGRYCRYGKHLPDDCPAGGV